MFSKGGEISIFLNEGYKYKFPKIETKEVSDMLVSKSCWQTSVKTKLHGYNHLPLLIQTYSKHGEKFYTQLHVPGFPLSVVPLNFLHV